MMDRIPGFAYSGNTMPAPPPLSTGRRRRRILIHVLIIHILVIFTPPVSNQLLAGTDISDTMRQIIQNGVILYALAKAKGGSSNE